MKKTFNYSGFRKESIRRFLISFHLLILVGLSTHIACAKDTEQRFTFNFDSVALSDIFREIESRSDYVIVYNENHLDLNQKVSMNVNEESVEKILDNIFNGTKYSYKIRNRQITIVNAVRIPADPVKITADQQVQTITGTVADSKGEPVIGASVTVKGTTMGALTDVNGKYTIMNAPQGATLVFSFIGMDVQEIVVGSNRVINVELKEATLALEEVVVIGYGTQKKQSIVGAITQTTNEELQKSGNVSNFSQALTGRLPGVLTITSSGEPGGTGTSGNNATSIYIRGRNTWNGGQPLILVDGIERDIDNLETSEVETISVLKDASATAVFGVKGANGVILVTTKRGSLGKPKLTFSYNTTALLISRLPEKLDAYETRLLKNESIERELPLTPTSWGDITPMAIANRYKLPQTPEDAMIFPNIDWKNALFKDVGYSHNADLNIQGGTNFVRYFGALSYMFEGDMFRQYENNKGYEPNYDFNRFNFRSNFDFTLTGTTKLGVSLSGYFGQKNTNFDYRMGSGINPYVWAAAYSFPPDAYHPQYPDGRWGVSPLIPAEGMPNPVASIWNIGLRESRTTQLNSDFTLDQNLGFITKGLTARAMLTYDNTISSEGGIIDQTNHVRPEASGNTPEKFVYPNLYEGPDQDPSEYIDDVPIGGTNQFDWVVKPWTLNQESVGGVSRRLLYQFQLNYNRKFGMHNLGLTGVMKRQQSASGSQFPVYREDWVFRTTYDFDSRYLLEMNGAYNGSEKFGPAYRFAFFPSVALGWYVSNEKFFKVDWMNRLKVRVSSGLVGDDNAGSRWLYMPSMSYGSASRLRADPSGTSPYTWYRESVVANPDAHWEKAIKNNYGVEIGLLKDMFSINFDYFTEHRTDILISGGDRAVPPFFGMSPPAANLGEVKADGYELEFKFNKRSGKNLFYWTSFSVTHTENEIIFRDDPILLDSYLKDAGYQISQTRTQVRTGFYNNWDEVFASVPMENNDLSKMPGFYNQLDFNADGIIKSEDVIPYGYPEIPQNTYNFAAGIDYKGLSFMLQFYGVNNVSRNIPLVNFKSSTNVLFSQMRDYWSVDNMNASAYLPRWKSQGQFIGDYWLYDGSYIRLKTAELAYTLQNEFLKRAGMSSLKIYLNGQNLLFWSKLPDDREAAVTGGSANEGAYPTVKRINLGVDITF